MLWSVLSPKGCRIDVEPGAEEFFGPGFTLYISCKLCTFLKWSRGDSNP